MIPELITQQKHVVFFRLPGMNMPRIVAFLAPKLPSFPSINLETYGCFQKLWYPKMDGL